VLCATKPTIACATPPGDAEHRLDRDQAARAEDADPAAATETMPAQGCRQPARAIDQLRIAQRNAVRGERQPVRRADALLEDGLGRFQFIPDA
jgi:hypothetical protein